MTDGGSREIAYLTPARDNNDSAIDVFVFVLSTRPAEHFGLRYLWPGHCKDTAEFSQHQKLRLMVDQ